MSPSYKQLEFKTDQTNTNNVNKTCLPPTNTWSLRRTEDRFCVEIVTPFLNDDLYFSVNINNKNRKSLSSFVLNYDSKTPTAPLETDTSLGSRNFN